MTTSVGQRTSRRRSVLMLCYLFPPAGGSAIPAVQRMLKFLRGMAEDGRWASTVLTLDAGYYEPYISREDAFLPQVPAETRVERTKRVMVFKQALSALGRLRRAGRGAGQSVAPPAPVEAPAADSGPTSAGRLAAVKQALDAAAQIPDPHIGWLPHAYRRGLSLIRRTAPNCIYATGSPWSALIAAALLARSTSVPLIVDFRDPWVTNPYRAHLPNWRKRIEARLERFVVGSAALVIANTRSLRDEFRTRYPEQPGPRIEAVYNSVEGTIATAPPGPATPGRRIRLTHAGFLYGPRDPATLLRAVARRRRAGADDVAIELVGAVELEYPLERLLAELGIADIVTVHGPVPHARCSVMLKESDALLLLQPGTRTQLPSKLFEYVTFGKPILTVAERDGETYRFAAEELHTPVGACDDEADIAAAIDRLVGDVRHRPGVDSVAWERMLAAYSTSAVTGQFLELLDWVAASKRAVPPSPVQSDPVRSD